MVVYSTDEKQYHAIAKQIADDRNEHLISDIRKWKKKEGPIVYVGSPEEMSERTLQMLQERLTQYGPIDGEFAAITGLTPEIAAELYFGSDDGNDSDVLVSSSVSDIETASNSTVLSGNQATAAQLKNLTADRLRSLTLEAPGWPLHVGLAEGMICGYPDSYSPDSFTGSRPFCASDDGMECPFDEELVSAESLEASHLMLSSCAPIIDNGTTGQPVHVGLQLAAGADSVLGGYRLTSAIPQEVLLHHSLIRSSYSLINRCYLLNRNSHSNAIAYQPYVPFGNPNATIDDPVQNTFEFAVEPGPSARLLITDIHAMIVDLSIPLSSLPSTDSRYYVQNQTPGSLEDTLYYTAFEEDDNLRLLLYTGGRIDTDQIGVSISSTPTAASDREVAFASTWNSWHNQGFGIIGEDVIEQVRSLWQETRGIPEKTEREWHSADAHLDLSGSVTQLTGNAEVIQSHLADSLTDGSYVMDHYANRAIDDDVLPAAESCSNCGRPIYIKQIGDGHGAYRSHGMCPRCGFRFDVPTEPGSNDPLRPTIEILNTSTDTWPIEVVFPNKTGSIADVSILLSLRSVGNTNTEGNNLFTPKRIDDRVATEETITTTFDFHSDRVYKNQHFLIAQVIANLEVYSAIEIAQTRDTPGYIDAWSIT